MDKNKEDKLKELEYDFVQDFIKLRKDNHLTQEAMANQSGVIRLTITRIENLITSPQINTLIKILEPVGYTVKIVPIDKKKKSKKD
ncbi:MAG TPA: helix-turn-helix transcriptional regulator [Candidatus Onthousia excrementipullorum]|uniref:Helix-turn-helix transcriptional regulator n=1 Tax=Candidatus Onthousia excrementipullorum TaxID=2840884 RepID=A0A9D1J350_9FIRM|nr:helix-turn-helix transcriptional regulator [Candidatus Onthousia excrementipullorum]